jgi:glycine cleavage system H lipoate-binding protein
MTVIMRKSPFVGETVRDALSVGHPLDGRVGGVNGNGRNSPESQSEKSPGPNPLVDLRHVKVPRQLDGVLDG